MADSTPPDGAPSVSMQERTIEPPLPRSFVLHHFSGRSVPREKEPKTTRTRPRASREGDDASSQRMSETASESSSSPRALRGRERADDGCRGTRRELVRRTSDAACIRVLRRMRLSREFAYQMRRSTDDSNSTHGGSLVAGVGVRLGWMPAGRGTTYDLRIEVITLYNNMHWS